MNKSGVTIPGTFEDLVSTRENYMIEHIEKAQKKQAKALKRKMNLKRAKKSPTGGKPKYPYIISYFNPETEEAAEKTWKFKNIKDAREWRKWLADYWQDPISTIKIEKWEDQQPYYKKSAIAYKKSPKRKMNPDQKIHYWIRSHRNFLGTLCGHKLPLSSFLSVTKTKIKVTCKKCRELIKARKNPLVAEKYSTKDKDTEATTERQWKENPKRHSIAHAAAWDEANRHMKKAGRKKWSKADYNVAVRTYNELMKIKTSPRSNPLVGEKYTTKAGETEATTERQWKENPTEKGWKKLKRPIKGTVEWKSTKYPATATHYHKGMYYLTVHGKTGDFWLARRKDLFKKAKPKANPTGFYQIFKSGKLFVQPFHSKPKAQEYLEGYLQGKPGKEYSIRFKKFKTGMAINPKYGYWTVFEDGKAMGEIFDTKEQAIDWVTTFLLEETGKMPMGKDYDPYVFRYITPKTNLDTEDYELTTPELHHSTARTYKEKPAKTYLKSIREKHTIKVKPKKNPIPVKDILKDIDIELDRLQDAITEGNLVDINKYEYGLWAAVGTLTKDEWRKSPQHEKFQKLLDKSSFYKKNQAFDPEMVKRLYKKVHEYYKRNPAANKVYTFPNVKEAMNFAKDLIKFGYNAVKRLGSTVTWTEAVTNPPGITSEKYITKTPTEEKEIEREWLAKNPHNDPYDNTVDDKVRLYKKGKLDPRMGQLYREYDDPYTRHPREFYKYEKGYMTVDKKIVVDPKYVKIMPSPPKKNPKKSKYYKMAKKYCGKRSKIYEIKDKKFPYGLQYTINVMYDDTVSSGVLTCIVDIFVGGTDPAHTFVFMKPPKTKMWVPAPERLWKAHMNPKKNPVTSLFMPMIAGKLSKLMKKNPRLKYMWFVSKPGTGSRLIDIVFKADIKRLELQFRGGLKAEDIVGIHTTKEEAEKQGRKLLKTITTEKELTKHITLTPHKYVHTMNQQIGLHTKLTPKRLKEALEEDTGKLVSLALCKRLTRKYVGKWIKNPHKKIGDYEIIIQDLFGTRGMEHGVTVLNDGKLMAKNKWPKYIKAEIKKMEAKKNPYKTSYVPAKLFLKHKGVSVYHVYKHDDTDAGERTHSFVLDKSEGEDESFDVRKLPGWKDPPHPPFLSGKGDTPKNRKAWNRYHAENVEVKHIKKFIKGAIDKKRITSKTVKINPKLKKKKSTRPPKEFWDKVYPDVERYYKKRYRKTFKRRAEAVTADIWHNKISPEKKAIFEYLRTHREQKSLKARKCPKCNRKLKDKGVKDTNIGKRKVWQCPKCKKYYAKK